MNFKLILRTSKKNKTLSTSINKLLEALNKTVIPLEVYEDYTLYTFDKDFNAWIINWFGDSYKKANEKFTKLKNSNNEVVIIKKIKMNEKQNR